MVNPIPTPNWSGSTAGILTKAEAADYLGISQRTLDVWRQSGIIACIERPGYIRFLVADLAAFLTRYRKEARQYHPRRPRPSAEPATGSVAPVTPTT